jgi:hypothetical protein
MELLQKEAVEKNVNIVSFQFFASHRFNHDGLHSVAVKSTAKRGN